MHKLNFTWPATTADGAVLQVQHRKYVKVMPLEKEPRIVAGVDAAFSEKNVFAAVCLFRCADRTLIEQSTAIETIRFPYVPGYLIFLEGPAIISALKKLKAEPDVILVDGHGIAHPRNMGSASHLGVLLDIPTIGCAKNPLTGEFRNPAKGKGSRSELRIKGKTVGAVLRTRGNVAPVFVSPGHLIDLDAAVRITLACVQKYRIPEPLRCADMLSRRMKRKYSGSSAYEQPGRRDAA